MYDPMTPSQRARHEALRTATGKYGEATAYALKLFRNGAISKYQYLDRVRGKLRTFALDLAAAQDAFLTAEEEQAKAEAVADKLSGDYDDSQDDWSGALDDTNW